MAKDYSEDQLIQKSSSPPHRGPRPLASKADERRDRNIKTNNNKKR